MDKRAEVTQEHRDLASKWVATEALDGEGDTSICLCLAPDCKPAFTDRVAQLLADYAAKVGLEALEALRSVESTVEFYLKREIDAPANHEQFRAEAVVKLARFRKAIAELERSANHDSYIRK